MLFAELLSVWWLLIPFVILVLLVLWELLRERQKANEERVRKLEERIEELEKED